MQKSFRGDLGLINIPECGCLDFILLVLHRVSQVLPLASLLTLILLPLIDRAEPLVTRVELREDMRLVKCSIIFFVILIENGISFFDFRAIHCETLIFQRTNCLSIGLVQRGMMLGVSLTNGQPIVAVDNYATFLHDAVGALGTRLFHIPDHLLVNTVADSFISSSTLSHVKFAIAIFVKQFGQHKVTVAYDTVTIEVEAEIRA